MNTAADKTKYCCYQGRSFNDMITHLRQDHALILKQNIDFCCNLVFESLLDSLEHFLTHICNLEEDKLKMEPVENIDSKIWLNNFFDIIKTQRTKIMKKLIFDEDLLEPHAKTVRWT